MQERFVGKKAAQDMIKPRNIPVLEAGYELTVKPGTVLRKVKPEDGKKQGNTVLRYKVVER